MNLVRWIDLGCPIDLDFDSSSPRPLGEGSGVRERGNGWLQDDNRPTLTLTYPHGGVNAELTRLLVGMHDYDSGLDMKTFRVSADFELDGIPAGQNLASRFQPKSPGVWEWKLPRSVTKLALGNIEVSVRDNQGNVSHIERSFSVTATRPD